MKRARGYHPRAAAWHSGASFAKFAKSVLTGQSKVLKNPPAAQDEFELSQLPPETKHAN